MYRNKLQYSMRIQDNRMRSSARQGRLAITDLGFCAAFSCPASICLYDSAARGIFYCSERGGLI